MNSKALSTEAGVGQAVLPTSPLIQRSWQRSAEAQVPSGGTPSFRRVSDAELQQRQHANRQLLDITIPHLQWLSGAFAARPRVAYCVDADGIVLHSEGDTDAIARFGLAPGFDWSEGVMGTNGAGTALVVKEPVAIVGCDHWSEAWHAATCLGAPIVRPNGQVAGAIDLSLDTQQGDAERLVVPAYAAYAISQELARRTVEDERQHLTDELRLLRQTQDALQESEMRFRLMADTSPLMIWVHNAEGGLEFVNSTYCTFFGVTGSDVLGSKWQPLVHPEDVGQYVGAFYRALQDGTPYFAEARVRRADGQWRWIASYGAPRLSADGRVIGMVGSSPDITEMKTAIAQARDAGRVKDEFLATVAHELRQPIHAASAALQFMAVRPGREAGERARRVLERQVQQMTRLVDDLLDAARIVRGTVTIRPTALDLRVTIRHAVEAIRPLMVERAHAFEVSVPDVPLLVRADESRLQQVLMNLLTNAAKYTDTGGTVVLEAALHQSQVRVTVLDTGRGIDPAQLPRVFDLFVRGTSQGGGFGIGLAVARRLVELHGGTIEANSAGPGHGARFTIALPVTPDAAGS